MSEDRAERMAAAFRVAEDLMGHGIHVETVGSNVLYGRGVSIIVRPNGTDRLGSPTDTKDWHSSGHGYRQARWVIDSIPVVCSCWKRLRVTVEAVDREEVSA